MSLPPLTVGRKLTLSFAVVGVFLVAVIAAGFSGMGKMAGAQHDVVTGAVPKQLAADTARAAASDMHFSQTGYALAGASERGNYKADRATLRRRAGEAPHAVGHAGRQAGARQRRAGHRGVRPRRREGRRRRPLRRPGPREGRRHRPAERPQRRARRGAHRLPDAGRASGAVAGAPLLRRRVVLAAADAPAGRAGRRRELGAGLAAGALDHPGGRPGPAGCRGHRRGRPRAPRRRALA